MSDEEENQICRLSFLSQPHHTLTVRDGRPQYGCFMCGQKQDPNDEDYRHYYCTTCNEEFHLQCQMYPRKMTHPYHPQHPLTLTVRNKETQMIADYYDGSDRSDSTPLNPVWFPADLCRCSWSGRIINTRYFYRCSICNFCLDIKSSRESPLLTIQNPKSHHHSLVLFPRPFPGPCDACGSSYTSDPRYVCFQCNYMVHEECINLPRVIRLTRHPHRLFHTPYLPPASWLCRICYKAVDAKYGQYSCQHENCSYVVHSNCATDSDVWDERELEWEPEEPDETEDIRPFESLGGDLIKHFSHVHHLRLEKYHGVQGEEKLCQGCILPIIDSHNFYNCLQVQCDFYLHEVCACLPRKLEHALHKHPLVLDPSPLTDDDDKNCSVCHRNFAGFRYKCSKKNCGSSTEFKIDVRCTIVPDYFTHQSHQHPLFFSNFNSHIAITCNGCKKKRTRHHIECAVCEYALCYRCATIPNELHYKYDKHPLSICYGEDTNEKYWCEVCEKELDPTAWFYTCNKCCITIHRKCLFGSSVYMNSGFIFPYNYDTVEVFRNNSNITRPICTYCDNRCVGFIYFKCNAMIFCSLLCIRTASKKIPWWRSRIKEKKKCQRVRGKVEECCSLVGEKYSSLMEEYSSLMERLKIKIK